MQDQPVVQSFQPRWLLGSTSTHLLGIQADARSASIQGDVPFRPVSPKANNAFIPADDNVTQKDAAKKVPSARQLGSEQNVEWNKQDSLADLKRANPDAKPDELADMLIGEQPRHVSNCISVLKSSQL